MKQINFTSQIISFILLYMIQCAAVSTHLFPIIEPPHICCLRNKRDTCHGFSSIEVLKPPIILEFSSSVRESEFVELEQTASIVANSKILQKTIFIVCTRFSKTTFYINRAWLGHSISFKN